ncbi:MAG: hypothetical protein C6Y22_30635 [Hapalosiphonaceae cyanobacterium JJU2]|nr:MAG: hypothetical protein C6Y22_30635 [Hapalosiphonaceae cyanobacterium JJU2]
MRIVDALPPTRYASAAAHARTDQFKNLKAKTIKRVQQWYADPRVNQNVAPGLWFGYGKDSMATALILELAELNYTHLIIKNGADLPHHWLVETEWQEYLGEFYFEDYTTDRPFPNIIRAYLDWGNTYGVRTKEGKLLNFWNWGAVAESITYEALYQFHHLYGEGEENVMYLWGNRAGEGMERAYEIAREGLFQFHDQNEKDVLPYIRALPLGDWKDIDVWALLVSENSPISPIYSMHQIPQKQGNKAFPRTLWYCTPEILCSQYYKWLAYYAPVQLKELCELFPEIQARFTSKNAVP